ncbi:isoleucyl-tRNA synthetase [Pedobacter flavus]|uniref:Isoleucyl-tRNA synthetase n=1 Tax=Pedobacter flavus TaxID=3113906 RepID=A0ABU7GZ05_9SPHI|nr:isoleucyl-tRNA synthetase [Pedobacter sp. VNH31]MEE1884003.1 isoleucyl-tRNA synthetase [Pedobacter sp. VNH31]
MIKKLKIQRGIWVIVLGLISLIIHYLITLNDTNNTQFALGTAGVLFIAGSIMLLYPIIIAKKDKDGIVQLDQEKIKKEDL